MPDVEDMGDVEDTDELEVERIGVIVLQVVRGVDLSRWRRFLNQLLTWVNVKPVRFANVLFSSGVG